MGRQNRRQASFAKRPKRAQKTSVLTRQNNGKVLYIRLWIGGQRLSGTDPDLKRGLKYEVKSGFRERIPRDGSGSGAHMYINLTDGSGYIYQIPVLTKQEIIKSGFDGIRSTDPDLVNGSGSGEFPKSILKLWICWTGMDPDPINKLRMRSGSVDRIPSNPLLISSCFVSTGIW